MSEFLGMLFSLALLVGAFAIGLILGVSITRSTAAVRWFEAHAEAERVRRESVNEVRAAWREKAARERALFAEHYPKSAARLDHDADNYESLSEVLKKL